MFGGSYYHNIDDAGRFVMPQKFRLSLGETFIITKGVGCLCVFTDDTSKQLETQLGDLGNMLAVLLDPNVARLHRHFFSGMVTSSCDNKQFRVQLTPAHRRYAGITSEVVVRGCGNFVELWAPDALERYEAENDKPEDLIASGAAVLPDSGAGSAGERDAAVPQAGPD